MTQSDPPTESETGKTAAPSSEANWTMRLAVISTVATVLALIVPFVTPYFFNESGKQDKTDLQDPETRKAIINDVKDDIKNDIKKGLENIKKDFAPPKPGPGFPFPKKN